MTKTIFIVEDDSLMINIYSRAFSLEGFVVKVAEDGEKAKEFLSSLSDPPSIFMLDVMMPKMNGFDLFALIKSVDKFKNVPVVFLTNLYSPEDAQKAKDLGADLYLVKSDSDPKEVVAKVKGLIGIGEEQKKS